MCSTKANPMLKKVVIFINVAIIGAGVAGLSCAFELEKYGIKPVIFEKKSTIGSPFGHNITTFQFLKKKYVNPVEYLSREYDLKLKPLYQIEELTLHAPNISTVLRKNLGYAFRLGSDAFSLEQQIVSQIRSSITLNKNINIADIQYNFDYIIVATGEGKIASDMNLWDNSLSTYVRTAIVNGNFKLGSVQIWINTDYSKKGYCYLVPVTSTDACLSLFADNISLTDLDFYWKEFLINAEINFYISETRDGKYNMGSLNCVQKDNVYFIGNAAGLSDDFFGFGVMRAIKSGIYAARSIAKGLDYSQMIKPDLRDLQSMHKLREAFNTFDNKDFNRFVLKVKK
jgi:flavin-dependent dehydrogenase